MSAVPASRMQQLLKLRSSIFQTTYNPTNARTGLKYLKAPLRGPSMMQYYPALMPKLSSMNAMIPNFGGVDPYEQQRLIDVEAKKRRGKGPPKKGQGRRSTMKRK